MSARLHQPSRKETEIRARFFDHLILIAAALLMGGPLVLLCLGAVQSGGLGTGLLISPGAALDGFQSNLDRLARLSRGGNAAPTAAQMILSSLQIATGVALAATVSGFLAAYAMTFLLGRSARIWFSLTLLTLYFPVEARMLQTFDVAVKLGLINTLPGLVLPILPLAVATLIFRAHMRSLPPELLEAARLDGTGPLQFLRDFVLPLSRVSLGAVFIICFLIGWNQYLWPLMISIDNAHFPLMRGLNLVGAGSGPSMVLAMASVLPPLVLVLGFTRLLSRATAVKP